MKLFEALARVENPEVIYNITESGILEDCQTTFLASAYNSILHNLYTSLVCTIIDQEDQVTLWAVGKTPDKVFKNCET